MNEWPAHGIWGAMPSVEYADKGLDSYHLHRWLDPQPDGTYEQWYAFFAEKDEVLEAAKYLNALESSKQEALQLLVQLRPYAEQGAPVSCGRCGQPDATCDMDCIAAAEWSQLHLKVLKVTKDES